MFNGGRFGDMRDWFFKKRFGLFVHWGLYAIPAWQEQVLWRGRMPRKEYEPLIHKFNPTRFDPDAWIDIMQDAGMEYLCFTTKHHDGFCMWDTKHTDYNIMHTPYGKDILAMLAKACERRGIVFGTYYSIPDWHHPNYPNQGRHHEMFGPRATDEPDVVKYASFMENQARELCTRYGKLGQFFWDVNVIDYNNTAFNDELRALQPCMLINNRGPENWDFQTPEREVPKGMEFSRLTEAVQSLGRESWGFRADEDYYSDKHLMQSIDKVMAMGGNYLLNVGPKADGTIDERDAEQLRRIGAWYAKVKEAFDDAVPATTMITQVTETMRDEVLLTRRGNAIYVHAYKDLQANAIILKPFDILPRRATLLNDGRSVECTLDMPPSLHRDGRAYLRLRNLPVNQMAGEIMVVKLEFDDALCD